MRGMNKVYDCVVKYSHLSRVSLFVLTVIQKEIIFPSLKGSTSGNCTQYTLVLVKVTRQHWHMDDEQVRCECNEMEEED